MGSLKEKKNKLRKISVPSDGSTTTIGKARRGEARKGTQKQAFPSHLLSSL
jgi:hypothetical protein